MAFSMGEVPTLIVVYALHMLKERLQLLVDPEQRRRLDAEARRRGVSVGAVVRDAIDAQLGTSTRAERARAIAGMRAARPRGPSLEPEEIERLIHAAIDDAGDLGPKSKRARE